jgi:UDP-N-acetyl-D-glucosamine dehydrogenase
VKETASLRRRILSRRATVAVVGLGHEGLSLACAAADAGFRVTAVDADERRIDDLRRGILSVPGVTEEAFQAGLASERITFSSDLRSIGEADVLLICASVPIRDLSPDLAFLEEISRQIGKHPLTGRLVVVESTAYPGATEEVVRPALERSGHSANHDFLLAYSPERIDPGNEEHGIQNTPRIVGGMTKEATGVAALFYGQLVDKVVQMSSCRAAEWSKVLEDTFRHVNVGLVNEVAVLCNEQGIDVWEVVEAASTKPFGFVPFRPGPGVRGSGLPFDRHQRTTVEREGGGNHALRLLEQARAVNSEMPAYVATRIEASLRDEGKDVKGARILALGITYKPNVGEMLESPAVQVLTNLKARGARVTFHDPYVSDMMLNGDALARSLLTERSVESADCVAILTPHSAYDLDWIARHAKLVFDARNAFGPDRRSNVVRL